MALIVCKRHRAVFGKPIQRHRWLIALHFMYWIRGAYEFLKRKLEQDGYVSLCYSAAPMLLSKLPALISFEVAFKVGSPWRLLSGPTAIDGKTLNSHTHDTLLSSGSEFLVEDTSYSADLLDFQICNTDDLLQPLEITYPVSQIQHSYYL
jgi:hypothetical protein